MSIAENLAHLHEQITEACRRANRSMNDVSLMAVSKVHPVEAILEAYAAGQRLFGENRVQEWQTTLPLAGNLFDPTQNPDPAPPPRTGPLQSNKTTRAAELFHAVDTVDSIKIA